MPKPIILTILLSFSLNNNLYGQNLVDNPSFEEYVVCPLSGTIDLSVAWFNPTESTPNLMHACHQWSYSTPTNNSGNQVPRTGEGYAGIFTYWEGLDNFGEYIEIELKEPLVAGRQYSVQFFVSLAENSGKAIKYIGAHFSQDKIERTDMQIFECCQAQVIDSSFITDKNGWVPVNGCFVAEGGEKYLTIGNFTLPDSLNVLPVSGGLNEHSYYYVDDVSVYSVQQDDFLGSEATICGDGSATLSLDSTNASYLWSDGSSAQQITVNDAGTYWLQLQDACGLRIDSIVVEKGDFPIFDLGEDTVICISDTLILSSALDADFYVWNEASTHSEFAVHTAGTYCLELTANGCSFEDCILVEVENCAQQLHMPNIFTPNGDGVNEYFLPVFIDNIPSYKLVILDRWGSKVFEQEKVQDGWNGTMGNKDCSSGTYFWLVTYSDFNGNEVVKSGTIQLVR